MPRGKRIDPTIKLRAINAVIQDGRKQADVAKEYGISAGWLSTQVKRMRKGNKRKAIRKVINHFRDIPLKKGWLKTLVQDALREEIEEAVNEMIKGR